MIVYKPKKVVLFKLKKPERITNVIPTAKEIVLRGERIVAVPHRVEETKVLRNLGFDVPSPIRYYYKWSGQYAPFHAQQHTAEFLTLIQNGFVLNDLGTGKTLATLWAYDYLRRLKLVNKALVISPLSTLERTWGDEIFTHFPHLNFHVLHGSRDKRMKLLSRDADIYLINHDGIKTVGLVEELAARDDIDLVIVDEIAQVGRTAGTDRWRALNTLCRKQQNGTRRVWGLTGTPTPNAPTDAWAQCRLINPSAVPTYFNSFKQQVMKQLSQYVWAPRAEATEIVKNAMQPAVRYTRDDCIDLPPCVYETRQTVLSPEQTKAYKDMMAKLVAEIDSGEVKAVNEAVKLGKLVQIACGVVYDSDHNEVSIPTPARLKLVHEIVEDAGTKVIVFVPFVSAVELVAEHLRKENITVEVIHGGVGKNERDRIFRAFQHSEEPKVLVAQPAAMSHGLTLTAASTIIWYAPITSNETYEQANGRITRPGQKHSQLIVNIEGSPVERRLYERLSRKQAMQGLLLDMVHAEAPA